MSDLIISISGVRGVVGDSLTPEVAMHIGQAYGSHLSLGQSVVVGGDTRTSFYLFKQALISGLLSTGVHVIDIGQCPTPTVQHAIRRHGAAGGLVITASHNPIQWNGIKLMNELGAFLVGDGYDAIFSLYRARTFRFVDWSNIGSVTVDDQAIDRHIDVIFDHLDVSSIQQSSLRVLVDVNHGTGAIADPLLFNRLGIQYELMYPEPDGKFSHMPEPIKPHLSAIRERLKDGNFDIGFVQDPDADRLIILAHDGTFIGEDNSLAYCVDYLLAHLESDNKQVVVNLSTSKVIEYVSKKHNALLHYSKIGEPNVTAMLQETSAQVGGEGNGGVIYPRVGWGRDSLLGIVVALKYLAESRVSVLDTVRTYPRYYMQRDKLELAQKDDIQSFLHKIQHHFEADSMNLEDGVKLDFGDSWLHVRPSNTEPIVRLFSEAETASAAQSLIDQAKALR